MVLDDPYDPQKRTTILAHPSCLLRLSKSMAFCSMYTLFNKPGADPRSAKMPTDCPASSLICVLTDLGFGSPKFSLGCTLPLHPQNPGGEAVQELSGTDLTPRMPRGVVNEVTHE